MPSGTNWTEPETLAAFRLYCSTPFGRLHQRNPEIIELAARLGRTPSAAQSRPNGAVGCSHGWSGEYA